MNSNNRKESEIYDVSTYNDIELYDILDLFNPTDRELEAKIIFLFRKYKNMQNESGNQLAKFFNDIYNHFFDNDNEEEENENIIEGMTNLDLKKQELQNIDLVNTTNNKLKTNIGDVRLTDFSGIKISDEIINSAYYADNKGNVALDSNQTNKIYYSTDSGNTFIPSDNKPTISTDNVSLTRQLNYTKDKDTPVNPLLKETVTRIISIDSQYRSDKRSLSTEFTFDLSDPLKDVVSLSLYSVQIPYTWYTISKSYGSNFFYIKGNSPGINNGNHNIKVSVSPGNYTPTDLVDAVQQSIVSNYSLYSDVSFVSTKITYNSNTSLSNIQLGITNRYNENSYELSFNYWTTPNIYDASDNLNDDARSSSSIPSFLGLNKNSYRLNTINTGLFTVEDINKNADFSFRIDPLSTKINIVKYLSNIIDNKSELYIEGKSIIDLSFSITLTLSTSGTKYSRNEIVSNLINQINSNTYLSSESTITLITVSDEKDIRYGNSYYELTIKPNRRYTNNLLNSKILVKFPDETGVNTPIWTGSSSCFRFSERLNETQLIKAETPIVKQTNLYNIVLGPYISLKCINPYFLSVANDISFNVKLNQVSNNVSQLIDAINQGIIDVSQNFPFLDGLPNLSTVYDSTSNRPPNYSSSFIDNNYKFSLVLDIEKTFGNKNYTVDFTGTIFNTLFGLGNDSIGSNLYNISSTPLIDNNNNIDISNNIGIFTQRIIQNGSVLFKINPIQDICGNALDVIGDIIYNDPTSIFFKNETISNTLTSYLLNYKYQDKQLFLPGTEFKITNYDIDNVQIILRLNISRKITSKDYSIQFIDSSNSNRTDNAVPKNFWVNPFKIVKNLFIDNPYNLETSNSPYLQTYNGSTAIVVKGEFSIDRVTLNFNNMPDGSNTFILNGYEDGVNTSDNTNNIVITIPIINNYYTRDILISTINNLLTNNEKSKGTFLELSQPDAYNNFYLLIRPNINKTYTAKDYKLVFYDTVSFVKCFVGARGIQNTTWDSTLGWILGYRNSTYYILNSPDYDYNYNPTDNNPSSGVYTEDSNSVITVIGDTAVSTNLYNYFLICLDDHNLNHLNDGLVTITGQDRSIPLPSYADRSNFQCDPVTKQLTYNSNSVSSSDANSQLTQKKLYSIAQIANSRNSTTSNILGGESTTSYGRGPFSDDVFALIPMKLTGLQNGSYFVEYGGTLQNNNRFYFGPVNIHRMSVKLISDKGNTVDLNGTNWSFSFLCQQLYKSK
jgi:hypothetical protein